jgi:hypothetical protein
VKVLGQEHSYTFEANAYHDALSSLAGTDLGRDPAVWTRFWHENGARLLEERKRAQEAHAESTAPTAAR